MTETFASRPLSASLIRRGHDLIRFDTPEFTARLDARHIAGLEVSDLRRLDVATHAEPRGTTRRTQTWREPRGAAVKETT